MSPLDRTDTDKWIDSHLCFDGILGDIQWAEQPIRSPLVLYSRDTFELSFNTASYFTDNDWMSDAINNQDAEDVILTYETDSEYTVFYVHFTSFIAGKYRQVTLEATQYDGFDGVDYQLYRRKQ